ncbi:MAG: TolC family protein [candidate division FCPU426 bacterium]
MDVPKTTAKLLLFCLLLSTNAVLAAEPSTSETSPEPLTVRQCLDLALANNPLIEASKQRVRAADAKAGQAVSLYFPRLGLEAGYTLLDSDRVSKISIPDGYYELFLGTATYLNLKEAIERGDLAGRGYPPGTDPYQVIINDPATATPYYNDAKGKVPPSLESGYLAAHSVGATVSLVQPLFTGGKIKGRNLQARWNQELERAKDFEATQDLLAEVCRTYFALAYAEQARRLGEELHGRFEALLLITEGFVRDLGSDKNQYDYLSVQTYIKQIDALLQQIKSRSDQGRMYLAFLTSVRQTVEVESNTRLPRAESFSFAEALSRLKENNPVWRQLELGRNIAAQETQIAQADLFPTIGLKGEYTLFHEVPAFGYVPENSWEATFGAQWDFPLGLQTLEAVKEKAAESRAVELQVQYAQKGLEIRLAAMLRDLEASREQVRLLEESAALAKERSKSAVLGYRVEMVDTDELIRSHVEESEICLKHLEAVLAYRQMVVEYFRLLGKDLHDFE